MKLIVLGSGTSVPHPRRSSAGFWLETTGGSVLLDCSPSAIHRMAEEHLDWPGLDAIWISHFHLDHCGGLAPFMFGIKHAPDTQTRVKPLKILGPKGLQKYVEAINAAGNYGLLEQRFPVELIEICEGESVKLVQGVTATVHKTPHTPESHAIRIDDAGRSFVYSSDTGPDSGLARFASSVDLLMLECSFFKNKPVEKHLELAEAVEIINAARPRRAMLTHFYPEWDDVAFTEELRKFDPRCEVVEAADGLRCELSTSD